MCVYGHDVIRQTYSLRFNPVPYPQWLNVWMGELATAFSPTPRAINQRAIFSHRGVGEPTTHIDETPHSTPQDGPESLHRVKRIPPNRPSYNKRDAHCFKDYLAGSYLALPLPTALTAGMLTPYRGLLTVANPSPDDVFFPPNCPTHAPPSRQHHRFRSPNHAVSPSTLLRACRSPFQPSQTSH